MKSKYMAVIPFLFAFGVLLISGCSVTTQKSTSSQENMPEIIIGSDDFPPFNKCSKNSPTSSGGEMNCTSEHICSKNPYIIKETLVLSSLM